MHYRYILLVIESKMRAVFVDSDDDNKSVVLLLVIFSCGSGHATVMSDHMHCTH